MVTVGTCHHGLDPYLTKLKSAERTTRKRHGEASGLSDSLSTMDGPAKIDHPLRFLERAGVADPDGVQAGVPPDPAHFVRQPS